MSPRVSRRSLSARPALLACGFGGSQSDQDDDVDLAHLAAIQRAVGAN